MQTSSFADVNASGEKFVSVAAILLKPFGKNWHCNFNPDTAFDSNAILPAFTVHPRFQLQFTRTINSDATEIATSFGSLRGYKVL